MTFVTNFISNNYGKSDKTWFCKSRDTHCFLLIVFNTKTHAFVVSYIIISDGHMSDEQNAKIFEHRKKIENEIRSIVGLKKKKKVLKCQYYS